MTTLRRSLGIWELLGTGHHSGAADCSDAVVWRGASSGEGPCRTAVLIGMVAMLFTAISYGRMARVYPSAGSAYTYVGQEIHPVAGFLTGLEHAARLRY